MAAEAFELDEEKSRLEFSEILKKIQGDTPHMTINIGVGEAVCLVGTLQLAMRHPAFVGTSRGVVENICRMLIDALASKDERIRPLLEMGFDER